MPSLVVRWPGLPDSRRVISRPSGFAEPVCCSRVWAGARYRKRMPGRWRRAYRSAAARWGSRAGPASTPRATSSGVGQLRAVKKPDHAGGRRQIRGGSSPKSSIVGHTVGRWRRVSDFICSPLIFETPRAYSLEMLAVGADLSPQYRSGKPPWRGGDHPSGGAPAATAIATPRPGIKIS